MPHSPATVGTSFGTSRLAPPMAAASALPAMRNTPAANRPRDPTKTEDPLGNTLLGAYEAGRSFAGWLLAPWTAGGQYLVALLTDAPDPSDAVPHPLRNTSMTTAMQQTLAPVMATVAQVWEQLPSAARLGTILKTLDQCLPVGLPVGEAAGITDNRAPDPDASTDQPIVITHEALSYPQAFWHLYQQLLKVDEAAAAPGQASIPNGDWSQRLTPHDEDVQPMLRAYVEPPPATMPEMAHGTRPEQRIVPPAATRALPIALQRAPLATHAAMLAPTPADTRTPRDPHVADTTARTIAPPEPEPAAPEPVTPLPSPQAAEAVPAARISAAPADPMYCPDLPERFSAFKVLANGAFTQGFAKSGGHLSGVLIVIQVPSENLGKPAKANDSATREMQRRKAAIQQLVDFLVTAGGHRYRAMVDFVDDAAYPPPQSLCWKIPAPYCLGSADAQRVIDLARKARDANLKAKAFLEFMHDKIDATRFGRGSETDFLHNQQAFERALAQVEGRRDQDNEAEEEAERVDIPKKLRASYRKLRDVTTEAAKVFVSAEKATQQSRDQLSKTKILAQRDKEGGDKILVLTQEKTLIESLLAEEDTMVIAFLEKSA